MTKALRKIIKPILMTILMLWSIGCTFRVPNTNRVPNSFSLEFAELNQPSLNTNTYISICSCLCNLGEYTPTVDVLCGPSDSELGESRGSNVPCLYVVNPSAGHSFQHTGVA